MIKVDNLTKIYKVSKKNGSFIKDLINKKHEDKVAVNKISFDVVQGEMVGFLGPNGAGKTTTLKMLSGLLYPTSGKVEVLGYEPLKRPREFLKQIGLIMGSRTQLLEDLPPMDSFELRKVVYQIPDNEFSETLDELVVLMDIGSVIGVQVRKLSLGQKMKCEFILAMLHRPKVLFLDEPTIGLDVVVQQKIRQFLKDYNQKYHATVLLTSHYMDDVTSLCDRIIVIKEGSKVYDGGLREFIDTKAKNKTVEVVFEGFVDRNYLNEFGEVVSFDNNVAKIFIERDKTSELLGKMFATMKVGDIKVEEADLEDLIKEIY